MPNNHSHAVWLEKKNKLNAKWAEGHANKHSNFTDECKTKATTKSDASKDKNHPSKLQLASSICQSPVTHCLMTHTKANTVFAEAFNHAMDLN